MLTYLEVPETLQRNSNQVASAGYEHTGKILIDLATSSAGHKDLDNIDILDVGCGVRFTSTIINRNISIKSYTGIEVNSQLVQFLKEKVEPYDNRFKYAHWNLYHEMYNSDGLELATQDKLPIDGHFDLIWLFSVFTHQYPEDSLKLLTILRKHIRANGKIFFSVFIDDELEVFEDKEKSTPLLRAFYGRNYFMSLIEQAGWKIELFCDKDDNKYIQHYLVCSPA